MRRAHEGGAVAEQVLELLAAHLRRTAAKASVAGLEVIGEYERA
jgi:hypothetical protein